MGAGVLGTQGLRRDREDPCVLAFCPATTLSGKDTCTSAVYHGEVGKGGFHSSHASLLAAESPPAIGVDLPRQTPFVLSGEMMDLPMPGLWD